jgi:hypothetical protein
LQHQRNLWLCKKCIKRTFCNTKDLFGCAKRALSALFYNTKEIFGCAKRALSALFTTPKKSLVVRKMREAHFSHNQTNLVSAAGESKQA